MMALLTLCLAIIIAMFLYSIYRPIPVRRKRRYEGDYSISYSMDLKGVRGSTNIAKHPSRTAPIQPIRSRSPRKSVREMNNEEIMRMVDEICEASSAMKN